MSKVNARLLAVGAAFALLATACSSASSGKSVDAPLVQGIGAAQYAIYLSPQSRDLGNATGAQSRVLLVNEDGTYTSVVTNGMDLGQIAWTDERMFFSDMQNDYTLDASGVNTVPSPKPDNQVGIFALDGTTSVGIFNDGFTNEGYSTQVVTSGSDKATKRQVEGNYFITGQCGKRIFGASRATGRYSTTGNPETEPMVFAQLTGTSNGKEHVVGSSKAAKEGAVAPDAPCVGGVMYYVANAGSSALGREPKPALAMWNTTSGEFRQVPLENATDKESLMRDDGTGLPQLDSHSVRGDAIEWYGADNSILSTNLKTGKTTHRFDVEGHTNDSASSKAVFSPDEVAVLVENNDGTDIRIVSYDRQTGEEVRRATLSGLIDDIPDSLILRGFAVRP